MITELNFVLDDNLIQCTINAKPLLKLYEPSFSL